MAKKNGEIESIIENFFFGEIDEKILFPFPTFSEDQKAMAKEMCDAFSKYANDEKIDFAKMDEEAKMPDEIYQSLKDLGLYGLGVPEEFGGMNLDYTLYSRVFAQVASFDGSMATMLGAHQSIGYKALLLFGSDEQKKKWLPDLATGEKLASFCLTEPGSGSDAYSIKTKAVLNSDGTYTLNGQKLWITNAGRADFYTVFCKTDHDDNNDGTEKISCFIVEKGMAGLSFGEKENKMGIRASETRAVFFDGVIVPKENLIGEIGKGFKIAMTVLNSGRLSLGGGCVGGMKTILKLATIQAKNRKQFGKPITEFGLIQDKLAKMGANIFATESAVYMTTGLMDRGMKENALESAICKVFGSEMLWETVDMGLQIAAGSGYMREYPYERIMRDSRINLIFEGTNEILRCFIALSGMRGPSEKLKELGKITDVHTALKDPIKSLGVLTDFAKSRLSKLIGTTTITKYHADLENVAKPISSMIGTFAIQVEDTLIKYGKKIIDNELPLKRISNMAIDLYISICVISRASSILNDSKISPEKKEYVKRISKLAIRERTGRFKQTLKEMERNSDKNIKYVSDAIVNLEGYGLDIIDF